MMKVRIKGATTMKLICVLDRLENIFVAGFAFGLSLERTMVAVDVCGFD